MNVSFDCVLKCFTSKRIFKYGKICDFLQFIVDIKSSDKGKYTCVVSNVLNTVQRDHNLDVLVVPTIAGPGVSDVDILKGERVTLNCMVDGNPVPIVR